MEKYIQRIQVLNNHMQEPESAASLNRTGKIFKMFDTPYLFLSNVHPDAVSF
jgi:hypothetical protein